MRGQTGDDIVKTVTVDIIGVHLRAARAEIHLVLLPCRIAGERCRLLPPSVLLENVFAAVAVHIAVSIAMIEPMPFSRRGDFVKGPLLGWLVPVGLGVSE